MTMRWTMLFALLAASWAADGSWIPTGTRQYYNWAWASMLDSGKVLAVGSNDDSDIWHCELYDPNTGTWAPTGSLLMVRQPLHIGYEPMLVRLKNGKILAIPQTVPDTYTTYVCEVYDPATGTWAKTGSLSRNLRWPKVICLNSGKVLLIGGRDGFGNESSSCEVFDPDSGLWTVVGSIPPYLTGAAWIIATALLPSGKVLVMGSPQGLPYVALPNRCALYDPALNTWSETGSMPTPRDHFTTVTLHTGDVLSIGGNMVTKCEIYDHNRGSWSETGPLENTRFGHRAVVLGSGKVLVLGGTVHAADYTQVDACEIFDPETQRWTATATFPLPNTLHYADASNQSATLLQSGKVLSTIILNGGCALYSGPLDPPIISAMPYTAPPRPTWRWVSSGGGNGTFRWKLDNSDLTSGSSQGVDLAFTPSAPLADGSHTLYVQERNDVGDWSESRSATVVVDSTPPSAALTISTGTVESGSTVTLTVAFSEPVVGFAASKLVSNNATFGTATASADQQTYSMPMTAGSLGPLHVLLSAYSVTDLVGNFMVTDAALDLTVVNPTPPTAVLTTLATSVEYGSVVNLTVAFSEPVIGFDEGSLVISNATADRVTASVAQQTFTVPMTIGPPGPLRIHLPAYRVKDLNGIFMATDATLDLTVVAGPHSVGPSTPGTSEIGSGGGGGCGVGGSTGLLLGVLCMLAFCCHAQRHSERK